MARRIVVKPGGGKHATLQWDWRALFVKRAIRLEMHNRTKLAAQLLRDKVVKNISRPVTKLKRNSGTYVDPSSRSKTGEYPKADTTRLMRDIFWQMDGNYEAIVGTTLDYGAVLEMSRRLDRSYLRRTHREQYAMLRRILAGGKKT